MLQYTCNNAIFGGKLLLKKTLIKFATFARWNNKINSRGRLHNTSYSEFV